MSNKTRIIHAPLSLLLAPIPHWVKLIWLAIKSYQGNKKHAWPSMETIGKRVINDKGKTMDKGQVSRGIKVLIDHGFLEVNGRRNFTCLMPDFVDHPSTNDDDALLITHQRKLITHQQKVDHPSTEVDHPSTTIEKDQLKGSIKGSMKEKTRTRARSLPDGLTTDQVFDSWNEFAQSIGFPSVRGRSPSRKNKIYSLAHKLWPQMNEAYQIMRVSSRWFREELRPGFDWVWNETNFNKIIEGNYLHDRYSNTNGSNPGRTLEDDFDAAFAESFGSHAVG